MSTTHHPRARALRGLLALCAALPLLAAAQPATSVKLGVIGPFTGASSDFGTPLLQGIKLAVDEINAVGGYLGRPLELVIRDDQGTPDVGLKGAQDLVAQGVLGTIGFCNTGVAEKSLAVFQNAKVPLIIPCATGTPLTAKYPPAESYIFRNSARDAIQAPFVVNDLVKRGWTKVAIFADTTGYGEAGLKDVEAALAAHQLRPVNITRFPLGVTDLKDELKTARGRHQQNTPHPPRPGGGRQRGLQLHRGPGKRDHCQRQTRHWLEGATGRCLAAVLPLLH